MIKTNNQLNKLNFFPPQNLVSREKTIIITKLKQLGHALSTVKFPYLNTDSILRTIRY